MTEPTTPEPLDCGPGAPPPGPEAPVPGPRNWPVLAIIVLAVTAMLLAGVYHARNYAPYSKGPAVSGAVKVGQPAPDFELKSMDGRTVRLSDYRGKAVLVNFWATWCEPCKIEMPWFVDLKKQYGPEGFEILGIADDDSGHDAIVKFSQEMGVNYVVLQGTDNVADQFGVEGLPTTFYIDRSGKVIDHTIGLVSHKEIEDDIKRALAGGTQQARSGK